MSAIVQVQCDPFARTTLLRELVTHRGCCGWCGQRGRCWRYWWEHDGLVPHPTAPSARLFCSVGCFRAYYAEKS